MLKKQNFKTKKRMIEKLNHKLEQVKIKQTRSQPDPIRFNDFSLIYICR